MKCYLINIMRGCGLLISALLLSANVAFAQGLITTPLQLAPADPVMNEFGQIMPGHGLPEEQRPLVQVLNVIEGMSIQDPEPDGTPGVAHDVIAEGAVGSGSIRTCAELGAGQFNFNFDANEMSGKTVFIRAYSHPTIAASPYYVDSEVKTLSASYPEVYFAMDPVNKLLKPHADSRGDGLTDLVREQLFGSASVDVFADMGDGRTVWDHFVAGTDWTHPDSFLAIASIRPHREEVEGHMTVVGEILEWASQTGRIYTIQYTTNLILGDFEKLSNAIGLAATPPLNVFTNLEVPAAAPIYYRVEVEWPDMPEEAEDLIRP